MRYTVWYNLILALLLRNPALPRTSVGRVGVESEFGINSLESESKDDSTPTRLQESGVDGVGSRGPLALTFLVDINMKSTRFTRIMK